MWAVLFIVHIALPSLLCKEYVPTEGITNDEKILLSRVIKRLEKGRFREPEALQADSQANRGHDGDDVSPACGHLTINDGMIIRSNDSLTLGAKFLDKKDFDSSTACVKHCCKDSSCDTVVFEKIMHSCYLFSCRGVCLFSDNPNYVSSTIDRHASSPATTPAAIGNGEEIVDSDMDLDEYNHDIGKGHADESIISDGSSLKEEKTTNRSESSGSTTAPSGVKVTDLPSSAHLGQPCDSSFQCQDPWAECSSQMCVCQEGYQQLDGVCQKQEPQESSQSSEEEVKTGEDTPTENQHLDEEHTLPASEKNATQGEDHDGSDEESSSSSAEETHEDASIGSEEDQHDVSNHNNNGSSSEENSHEQGSVSSEEENEDLSHKESGSDSEEETHQEDSSSEEEAVNLTQKPPVNEGAATDAPTTSTTAHDKSVSVEKVGFLFGDVDLQVPIIALSVGLAFTMILLLFVSCRFCRARRQLKKGRPLHGYEADYLINGMYL